MTELLNPPIQRPTKGFMKWFFKSPLIAWRMGHGFIFGRWILILTTTGRKSGLPRHTPLQFFGGRERKYIISGWGEHADWYKNMLVYPNITIQSAYGVESVRGREVMDDEEYRQTFQYCHRDPIMRWWMRYMDIPISEEAFLVHKDKFLIVTFEPTSEPTPPPLKKDLAWLNLLMGGWVVWRVLKHGRR